MWLVKFYIKPESIVFKLISILSRWFWGVWFGVFFAIVVFPAYYLINEYKLSTKTHEEKQQFTEIVSQKNALYQSLVNKNKENKNEMKLIDINQQISQMLGEYQMRIGNLQWDNKSNKGVYLMINESAKPLLNFLEKLINQPNFSISELVLTKDNEQKTIRMESTLVIQEN